ncbi:aldehyde dehydrogenase family protein [Paragemmobacter straminiformis]|uniref:Aldehyde dehydrogenase family protein n=1 Tax=Paragemmobacter straminiformis TaxID=2045119 RepID=A0A842I3T2_9RHOB|nr:aldehyde dehydrogenase family protein [Gemmobacter straminiformis]MBC2834510.1 aldehyde dehydrogenase family protein [Gemmobacter straminiformis]
MINHWQLYIDGTWVEPLTGGIREVIDPTTESVFASVGQAGVADVDRAVLAARRAFVSFSKWGVADRIALIDRIIAAYKARADKFADIIAREVGIPVSSKAQVSGPIGHLEVARNLIRTYAFERHIGDTIIRREPIGVCALIAPWNWPIQTPVIKMIYALAAGCTVVLKPSDASPLSAILLAEVMHEAKVPPGVFNLVIGRGRVVGEAMAAHPEVDMISFTGSTGAGAKVGEAAARTVKRTCLELGGKSANVVLQDADLEKAARWNIQRCFFNTGQSCHAPSRMIVHQDQVEAVLPFLADEASRFRIGDPRDPATTMGPAVSLAQYETVQRYIQSGIDQGARLVCGGLGRPDGLSGGYFVRPTVFADVRPDMVIAKEEIFGPVLCVIPYRTEAEAIAIANDSIFGLGGYVFGTDRERGYRVCSQIAAGRVCFNGAATNSLTPMGGYKQSGIGRSMGVFGLEEYLEVKSVYGFATEAAELPEHV